MTVLVGGRFGDTAHLSVLSCFPLLNLSTLSNIGARSLAFMFVSPKSHMLHLHLMYGKEQASSPIFWRPLVQRACWGRQERDAAP